VLSIGMFTYSTKPRGSVVHAASVADALVGAGHDVTLYALGQAGSQLYRPVTCNVTLFPAKEAPADKDDLVRQRVAEFVAGLDACDLRHDVLHAQDCLAASALLQARAQRAAPIVRTVHHVEDYGTTYLAQCQRRSIVQADEVFAVSRRTQREVESGFARSSRLVTNGVDLERFANPSPDRAWLKERFGVPSNAPLVLSVGGVEPRKNARRALEAVTLARAAQRGLTWIIAGGSSLWDHSAYASEFDAALAAIPGEVRPQVVRTGPLSEEDLTALYRLADVLLFPSLHEGFGLCVLEAMASGAAVIVPRGEPFTEYVDADSAVFVDPLSVEEIAGGLASLLDDASRRASLARVARERATAFTWSRSAATHLAHYRALLARRHPEVRSHA
jgi:glycosyltransferase-like protein